MAPGAPDGTAGTPPPMRFSMGHGPGDDGSTICQVVLAHGQLQQTFLMAPADLVEFARQAAECARQAGASGLVVPSLVLHSNGRG